MAIVKMKKLRVMAMASQRGELLKGLLRLGCVEISEPELNQEQETDIIFQRETPDMADIRNQLAAAQSALDAVREYGGRKDGLFIERKNISESEFLSDETMERARAVSDKLNGLLRELSRLRTEESRLESRKAALTPWNNLDMPLENTGTAHVNFKLVVFPGGTDLNLIQNALESENIAAELFEINSGKQILCALLICHRDDEEKALEILRPYSFSVTAFQGLTGTPAENIADLDNALAENHEARDKILSELQASGEYQEILRIYTDRLSAESARETGAGNFLTDGVVLYFTGWAPAEKQDLIENYLNQSGCAWELSDPDENDKPPVQLKNNILTRPLNMVTEMYSLPDYHHVDPNPLMAPFFILFYGIMMADMGYGLLMLLAGVLVTRKYKPKGTMGHLFGLMTLCGISTFIMGAITGGFFGDFLTQIVKITTGGDFALPALFTPLDDTLMILIGSMCLGLVQIITGMAVSFYLKIKRGQILDAVFEEVTWWIVFAGIACMALNITNLVLYAGIAMVIAGPIATQPGIGKITGIFGSLYNHVTGFFGDILSYSRLMALMLAGSVIAQVFNTLGAIPGNIIFFLIISIAGNALNFALNLLGCYVHDLRLQCLEYFGKFYEDGGRPFHPLAINTKFVDVDMDLNSAA